MTKALPIFTALALIAGACTNPLETRFDQDPETIILNAMFRTDEPVHVAWLSRGLVNDIQPLPDAQLRCYINGELVEEGVLVPQDEYYYASKYEFSSKIQPGDEVRLEAVDGSLRASTSVTAPRAAQLVSVDTTYLLSPYLDQNPAIACKLKLQDLPDQANWYRLSVLYEEYENDRDWYDGRILKEEWERKLVDFAFLQDPILADSSRPDQGNRVSFMYFLGSGDSNTYCFFQDTPFADTTADVEIHVPNFGHGFFSQTQLQRLSLEFTLLTIPEEEYNYLIQVQKSLYDSTDYGALREPIHVPGNVEGGLGFFTVESASTLTVQLPEYDYSY
jgi:hypothetical protein